ncbi:centrosomal protein of 112 kDa [Spea bombifrons]|uniref:centrosomal protein of 112 kDa n=1 Tax=Spea bombifrons TaxID=233779 RepID=UPI00234AA377|nr:centrosomal protein of 112 kDa [Spea bombifrons]
MDTPEDTWERLDTEFDHYLVDMKPYVLKLPQTPERQRCALWIRKLCDPSGSGTGISGRKNRNLYAKLLLHMLKRGVLEGPFTQRPDGGPLKTLPTYMSIYFDEPNSTRFQSSVSEGPPDWVLGELEGKDRRSEESGESWRSPLKTEAVFETSPSRFTQRLRSLSSERCPGEENAAARHTGSPPKKPTASLDNGELEARLNSWNLGIESPRYLREKPIPRSPLSAKSGLGKMDGFHDEHALPLLLKKEVDRRIKMLEAGFHEEKLRMQQKHDADVQKILDRKNSETEELKSIYKSKQEESEESVRQLEKKVQTLVRECQVIRESKETQITQLKKMCERSADSLRNEWQKKLHDAMADGEREKMALQKKHTENIQQLLDETNARLLKMESDYVAQTEATAQTVKELECRVQQLTVEVESSNSQRQRLSQEKAELDSSYQALCRELEEAQARLGALQKERNCASQEHEERIQQLQSKHRSDVSFVTQQNALSAAKAADVIEELEQRVSRLKEQLQESEHQRLQQLRDQENRFQKEKLHAERLSERKAHDLHKQLEDERDSARRKISKLDGLLKEREEQLARVTETQRLRAQEADAALEEFKRQVESNTEKVYSEMKQQMEKVEADLTRSKSLREKQSEEFSRELEELKQSYEQQIVELRLKHEEEKTYLFQQHNADKDRSAKDHQQAMDRLEKQLRTTMSDHETKSQQWRERDAQTIADLEAQVHRLKEELIQVNSQRKQQLVELGLLRDEERQKAAQEHQAAASKLRADMESMRLNLQKTHAAQTEAALGKARARLERADKEYSEKLAKSAQVVSELQATIVALREQSSRQQSAMERRLQETTQNHEEQKRQLTKDNEKLRKLLKEEVESYRMELRSAEKGLQEKELSAQEQVTNVRQEYEQKIRGLMPAAMRQELEDTIASLKSQVNFLQKRVHVLQEDRSPQQNRRL